MGKGTSMVCLGVEAGTGIHVAGYFQPVSGKEPFNRHFFGHSQ